MREKESKKILASAYPKTRARQAATSAKITRSKAPKYAMTSSNARGPRCPQPTEGNMWETKRGQDIEYRIMRPTAGKWEGGKCTSMWPSMPTAYWEICGRHVETSRRQVGKESGIMRTQSILGDE